MSYFHLTMPFIRRRIPYSRRRRYGARRYVSREVRREMKGQDTSIIVCVRRIEQNYDFAGGLSAPYAIYPAY